MNYGIQKHNNMDLDRNTVLFVSGGGWRISFQTEYISIFAFHLYKKIEKNLTQFPSMGKKMFAMLFGVVCSAPKLYNKERP